MPSASSAAGDLLGRRGRGHLAAAAGEEFRDLAFQKFSSIAARASSLASRVRSLTLRSCRRCADWPRVPTAPMSRSSSGTRHNLMNGRIIAVSVRFMLHDPSGDKRSASQAECSQVTFWSGQPIGRVSA